MNALQEKKMFENIDWNAITIEAFFGAFVEGFFLLILAMWVVWKGKKALREGRFEDMVLFSFNFIDYSGEAPQLGFRTPLMGSMKEIFQSDSLIREIKIAAKSTTDAHPLIHLSNPQSHMLMQRHLINFCNQVNVAGQMALLNGQPYVESAHRLAFIYEPSAKAKLFRVIPINEGLLKELDDVKETLTFGLPYHADRLATLKAVEKEIVEDQNRPPEARILAPFRIATPMYGSSQAKPK